MIETLRHTEAFEYYFKLGGARNLPKVAQFCGTCINTIKKWSKAFDWQMKIVKREEKVKTIIAKQGEVDVIRSKKKDMRLLEAAKTIWAQQITGKVEAQCPECGTTYNVSIPKLKAQFKDITEFIRLSELLAGEADSREEHIIKFILTRPGEAKQVESEVING